MNQQVGEPQVKQCIAAQEAANGVVVALLLGAETTNDQQQGDQSGASLNAALQKHDLRRCNGDATHSVLKTRGIAKSDHKPTGTADTSGQDRRNQ